MSQLSYYAAEILALHNNDNFKSHCRTLMSSTNENKAVAALALAVFGEAPATIENGYLGGGQNADDDSGLVAHARRELGLAGLFDQDSDFDGKLGEAVMELVRVFAVQGHSGYSAKLVIDLFTEVASYKALSPIGKSDEEWMFVAEDISGEPGGLWQNRRRSTTFSRDGGRTWYDIEDKNLNNGDMWRRYEPVQLGAIAIGEDKVRVKDDAYEGVYAEKHNSKEGLVVGVRNGMVTVKYTDDDTDVMGHQHQPEKLERYISEVS